MFGLVRRSTHEIAIAEATADLQRRLAKLQGAMETVQIGYDNRGAALDNEIARCVKAARERNEADAIIAERIAFHAPKTLETICRMVVMGFDLAEALAELNLSGARAAHVRRVGGNYKLLTPDDALTSLGWRIAMRALKSARAASVAAHREMAKVEG